LPLTLMHPAKCQECKRIMRAGTEASWIEEADGKFTYVHANECPEREDRPQRQQNVIPLYDPEQRFILMKCSVCIGVPVAVFRDQPRDHCCYCGTRWNRWEGC
jgi:hypothetical protein